MNLTWIDFEFKPDSISITDNSLIAANCFTSIRIRLNLARVTSSHHFGIRDSWTLPITSTVKRRAMKAGLPAT